MANSNVQPVVARLVAAVKGMLRRRAAPASLAPERLYLYDADFHRQTSHAGTALMFALIDLRQHRESRASDAGLPADAWDVEHTRLVAVTVGAHRRFDAVWEACASCYGQDTTRDSYDEMLLLFDPLVRGLDNSPGPALDLPWVQEFRDAATQRSHPAHGWRAPHIQDTPHQAF